MPTKARVLTALARVAGIVVMLAACATPQTDLLREQPRDTRPRADITNVPFYAQRTKECGPATLAMALGAAGITVSPDDLVKEVYTPGRDGSLTTGLVTAARRRGMLTYRVNGLRDLFHQVGAGTPAVVLLNLALPIAPQWHYAVLVGYDLDQGTVTLHSGQTPRLTMPMETFERTWERGDYWAMVVLEPGNLPARPNLERYLNAVVGLERGGHAAAAHTAYLSGARIWPNSVALAMGVGNTLYALNRPGAAARVFEDITKRHPEAADAFNNLAHIRFQLGELAAAERAARRAVAIGGKNMSIYTRTLASILARKGPELADP